MSTKEERAKNAQQMHEKAKEAWLDFIETFKNMRLLWDPNDKHYTNRSLRNEAREKLLEKFKKIDICATVSSMTKKLINMRAAYHRERRKVLDSIESGGNYRPTLWYYDLLTFYEASDDVVPMFNTIKYFRKTVPSLKRPSVEELYSIETPEMSNEQFVECTSEKEEDSEAQPPPPKRRIYHLLQKQEKFIDTAGKMLGRQEEGWEVHGKAIGLQLDKLDDMQRAIANKLIAETIYYGNLGKLTTNSYVHINDIQQLSPESGKAEAFDEYDDNSRDSKKREVLFIKRSPSYNDYDYE